MAGKKTKEKFTFEDLVLALPHWADESEGLKYQTDRMRKVAMYLKSSADMLDEGCDIDRELHDALTHHATELLMIRAELR